ncbi:hypothetical protein UlMin_027261 [Ulmus minor]
MAGIRPHTTTTTIYPNKEQTAKPKTEQSNRTKNPQIGTDCVGAIDGTHIPCIVDAHLQPAYRNRKGYTSQNVLAVVDFDLKFTYLVAGWEGSVHDARVLREAMSDPAFSFPTPPGEDSHDEDDMDQGGDTIGQDAAPSTQQEEGHQTEMGRFWDALTESMWACRNQN